MKARFNRGRTLNAYFWRDKTGHEVDLVVEQAGRLIPVDIKSGKTITPDYFRGLGFWRRLAGEDIPAYLVYGGEGRQIRRKTAVFGWNSLPRLFRQIEQK
jgi:predicted AAA+ superfamily ATPase